LAIVDLKISSKKTERHHLGCTELVLSFAPQPFRHLSEIVDIIAGSPFSEWTIQNSIKVMEAIAAAEAKVHQESIEHVHFHEIGMADTIVDVVGAFVLLERMGKPKCYASALNVGGGFVQTEHGLLPVPAPATIEILRERNVPIFSGVQKTELVTPTGAALIASLVEHFGELPRMEVLNIGYGAGTKIVPEIPNTLRVIEGKLSVSLDREDMLLLECSIDDQNPENYDYLMDRLFENGARDVNLSPTIMKKNRPGIILSVLVEPQFRTTIEDTIFQETTTLGIKALGLERTSLKRDFRKVRVQGHECTVKIAFWKEKPHLFHPEYDECCLIARKTGLPLRLIQEEAITAARQLFG